MPTESRLLPITSWQKGIYSAVAYLIHRKTRTRDLKGTASTGEFTRAILDALENVKVEDVA